MMATNAARPATSTRLIPAKRSRAQRTAATGFGERWKARGATPDDAAHPWKDRRRRGVTLGRNRCPPPKLAPPGGVNPLLRAQVAITGSPGTATFELASESRHRRPYC